MSSRLYDHWHGQPVRIISGAFKGVEGQADGTTDSKVEVYIRVQDDIRQLWFRPDQLERQVPVGEQHDVSN